MSATELVPRDPRVLVNAVPAAVAVYSMAWIYQLVVVIPFPPASPNLKVGAVSMD